MFFWFCVWMEKVETNPFGLTVLWLLWKWIIITPKLEKACNIINHRIPRDMSQTSINHTRTLVRKTLRVLAQTPKRVYVCDTFLSWVILLCVAIIKCDLIVNYQKLTEPEHHPWGFRIVQRHSNLTVYKESTTHFLLFSFVSNKNWLLLTDPKRGKVLWNTMLDVFLLCATGQTWA